VVGELSFLYFELGFEAVDLIFYVCNYFFDAESCWAVIV